MVHASMTTASTAVEESSALAAVRAGDESAFVSLAERYRGQLRIHCYRMLGSLEDAEDLVQETFLRAWRHRARFEGRSSFRGWLYRIATNACLDAIERAPRRVLPWQLGPAMADATKPVQPAADLPGLQPFPDRLLDPAAPGDAEPDAQVVRRETIEIAFLVATQLLPPKQRAVLILCDVLDWSAKESAALLDTTVAAVNGALQRARATLREHLPERARELGPVTAPTDQELAVLRRFIDAFDRADTDAVAALLRDDARGTMPPTPSWHQGRASIVAALRIALDPASPKYVGHFRMVPTSANRQPAAAAYLRTPGDSVYRAFALDVLRIEQGQVVEITSFLGTDLFAAFGFPLTLDV
jgi:RNA polymerase sigma-70 factor (ECF subfamily)